MKKEIINWKFFLRVSLLFLILFIFYKFGSPASVIVLLGFIFLLFLLLKGVLYKKIDNSLSKRFPFLSKLNPFVKKIIIIFVFVLVYIALKQVIFWVLGLFGVDVQQIINESINP
ncbi:MAG: hypothetical protein WC494_01950 [Candidatus Pacearchaeota archaeon]